MASNPCMQGGPSAGGWAARWSAADHRQVFGRGGNDTIAFIFVRSANKKQPLSWLSSVAHAMALAPIGSAVHLVQKRPLTHADAACVRSLDNIGTIRVHDMPSDDTEAGPSGGRNAVATSSGSFATGNRSRRKCSLCTNRHLMHSRRPPCWLR